MASLKRDLLVLAAVAAAVPLIWIAFLGFRGGLLGSHDATLYYLFLSDLVERRVFEPAVLGGVAPIGVYGAPPFVGAFGPVFGINAAIVLTQVLHGVLGAFAALDLAALFRSERTRRPSGLAIVAGVMLAFTPVLGMRLSYGHFNLVWGTFALTAPLALIAAVRSSRLTLVTLGLATLALVHTFRSHGFQTILASALFGGPLLLAVALHRASRKEALRSLAVAKLVALSALLLSLPALVPMLRHALGPDTTRTAGDLSAYQLGVASSRDLWSSLPWTPSIASRGPVHESQYAFGPPLLLLALLPIRRARAVFAALLFMFVVPALFALDVRPISTAVSALPFIAAFRFPGRALLPFAMVLPIFALAAVFTRKPRVALAATSILGLGAIVGFGARLLPFITSEELEQPRALGRDIRARAPELTSPLDRVNLVGELPAFGPNTAWASGLSSLNGYGYPTRRFLALGSALTDQPFRPLENLLRFDPRSRASVVLGQLFNVRVVATPGTNGTTVTRPGETAGRAWFSARIERVATLDELRRVLLINAPTLARTAHQVMWLVGNDGPMLSVPPECEGARVEDVTVNDAIHVRVVTPADCPLTLAMNHLDGLTANGQPMFPSYGTLAAAIVPKGTTELVIR